MSYSKKTLVALFGGEGRMGRSVVEQSLHFDDLKIVSKKEEANVIIDFSSAEGAVEIGRWCMKNNVALVSGSTGLNDKQMKDLRQAGKQVPVFYSPNMSPGVNSLVAAIEKFMETFIEGEVTIEETHHKNKKDAPSGTAKLLHRVVADGAKKRVKVFAPVSLRGGDVFGIHKVSFFSQGEWISFEHHATGRSVFAQGALMAARWIAKQPAGFYEMRDLLKDLR